MIYLVMTSVSLRSSNAHHKSYSFMSLLRIGVIVPLSTVDWLIDPFEIITGSLLELIWRAIVAIPLFLVSLLAVFWPLMIVAFAIVIVLAVGNLLAMILDSKIVRFTLATKQWPRTVLTASVVLAAIIAVAASNGFLAPALSSLVNAYATNVPLWIVTVSFLLFIVGAALSHSWMKRSLSFRNFHELIVPGRRR